MKMMDNEKQKKRAKHLFILWVISYVVFGLLSNGYVLYQRVFVGYDPIHMLSGYQILSFVVLIIYFIPLLLIVLHDAKETKMRRLCKFASFFLVYLVVSATIMLLFTIRALVY